MKKLSIFLFILFIINISTQAQEVQTLFKGSRSSGGYGAISNKFTSINGEYANLAEVYGGWFIGKKLLLGLGAAASTNDLRVPLQHSIDPMRKMSWQYAQFGMMTEYVFWSNRVVHFNFSLFSGAGMTVQYERHDLDDWDEWDDDNFDDGDDHDENFFFVVEPGVQLEVNLLKWMRLSPGISYRKAYGSDGIGLRDRDLSDWSYNVTLKFGRF